jgi:hypothetical protein
MQRTFEIFYSVVNELHRDDVSSLTTFQKIFIDSNEFKVLKTDLIYIHANFSSVTVCNRVYKDQKYVGRNKKEISDI